jgi:hypothetical protein
MHDFKVDMEAHLASLKTSPIRKFQDIIDFNNAHPELELPSDFNDTQSTYALKFSVPPSRSDVLIIFRWIPAYCPLPGPTESTMRHTSRRSQSYTRSPCTTHS